MQSADRGFGIATVELGLGLGTGNRDCGYGWDCDCNCNCDWDCVTAVVQRLFLGPRGHRKLFPAKTISTSRACAGGTGRERESAVKRSF